MTILRYWGLIEITFVIVFISFVIKGLWRKAKERKRLGKTKLPESFGGKAWYIFKYVFRIIGVGVGTLVFITLVIMIERVILSVYSETAPAPSTVEIPADLAFDVEEVTFQSEDGVKIAGWFVPSQNGATVILLHGYGGNRTATIWYAERLTQAGYGVLMYDERASGESGGDRRSYGWEDPRDVGGALDYLASRPDAGEEVGILGCSIGGQIALQGAAYHPGIAAVWADGPSSVRAQDVSGPENPLVDLVIVGNYLLDWTYELKLGIEPPAPMIDIIGTISPRPVMIVAGGVSKSVLGSESDHVRKMVQHAGENAELWIIPEVTHCDGPARRPDEYATRMVEFFNAAFGIK
ncbi:MAG: alpha/beta fold hydrolase [Chloroflexota bacterium]